MIAERLNEISSKLPPEVKLVAVSKFHPAETVMEAYSAGHRIFGESRPQEFFAKKDELPEDIQWHFIGHLQTNKLKFVLPYVSLVHSVDSLNLLQEIDKWGRNNSRTTDVLLEMHIGAEQTKQGFHEEEILDIMFNAEKYSSVRICGLMGMATNTDDREVIRADFERISDYFEYLRDLFPEMPQFKELSIGMSSDWDIALECGATMIRVGTSIFGERNY